MADQPHEAIRAFLALDLDPMSLRRVARVADRLRTGRGAPSATWVASARLHVTLKFIAELPVAVAGALCDALQPLAECKSAPKLCTLRLGVFPTAEQARVVVVELEDSSGGLARLADKVDKLACRFGIPKEER